MKASTPLTLAGLRRQWAPWAARWERQAKRIDALSLRERAILFLCIAAVLAAALDALVLSPLGMRAQHRATEAAIQAQELKALRDQFVQTSRGGDNSGSIALLQAQLRSAQQERERLDRELATSRSAQIGASAEAGLPAVLQALLAQQPGLTLTRLQLLDDGKPLSSTSPGGSATAVSGPAPLNLHGMRWQGVELQLQGPFNLQERYVQALERQLPGLQWGELRLLGGADRESPQLTTQVHVLRVQP